MVLRSQSAIHNKTKMFSPPIQNPEVFSQSKKHVQQHMLKVMVIDDKAYWVKNNIFFVAETNRGNVLHDSAKQVDTSNMSKADIDKMMFILDKLNEVQE